MAGKKEYRINVQGQLVPVTEEVYLTYYRAKRYAKWLEEKDRYNGTFYYNAFDTDEFLAGEMIIEQNAISVEDIVVHQMMREKLHEGMKTLTESERALIIRRYWNGESQKKVAEVFHTSQQAISYRERKILAKLKKYLEV